LPSYTDRFYHYIDGLFIPPESGNYTFFTSSNGWLYLYMNSQPNNVDNNTELICKNTDQNDDVVKTHFREYNNPNDPS